MGIDLKDTSKYRFGSVEWQDAMKHNIVQKILHKEQLGSAERCFIDVQKQHDFRVCKPSINPKANLSQTLTMDSVRISLPKGSQIRPVKDDKNMYQDEIKLPSGGIIHRTVNKVTGDTVVEHLKGKTVRW